MSLKSSKIRRWIVVIIMLGIFGVFVAQLLKIQIVNASYYQSLMEKRTFSAQHRKAIRGEILDRNGEPIVINEMGYSLVLDKAFLPTGKETNETILRLMSMFDTLGEEWIDNLPITTTAPYQFIAGREDDIARVKGTKYADVAEFATVNDVMYQLINKYKLTDYTPAEQRKLLGVRYEMERRDFSISIPYSFATDLQMESVIYLKERSFELIGVNLEATAVRKYVQDDLAPHIIGSVGPLYAEEYESLKEAGKIFSFNTEEFDSRGYTMDDVIGKGGIEAALEEYLRGSNGKREIFSDSNGEIIESTDTIPAIPGHTVKLTIDGRIQRTLQDALAAQIEYLQTGPVPEARGADAGAGAVIKVKTGEILALASYPTYTLTDYRTNYEELANLEEPSPLFNRAVLGQYAPGSIFKPVTAIAAMEKNIVDRHSLIYCSYVYEQFASSGYRPKCLFHHGNINVVNALKESCNIYFYESGRLAGIDAIDNISQGFGLGEPTGIEIHEAIGARSNPQSKEARGGGEWYEADTVQTAIGQFDNKFSPLQLANYAATIGNRGERMELTLIDEVLDYSRENVIQPFEPVVAYKMVEVPSEAFEAVVDGMVAASEIGTARGTFSNYPIKVASKTGTPQVNDTEVNSTFIAFAPADAPEIAVAIIIDKGWHGYTGASVAKAVFDEYFGITDVNAPVTNGPDLLRASRKEEARLAEEAAEKAALEASALEGTSDSEASVGDTSSLGAISSPEK